MRGAVWLANEDVDIGREGEVLESFVTRTLNKKADRLETGRQLNNRAMNSHSLPERGLLANRGKGHFEGENGQCCGLGGGEVCRNSSPFTLPSTITLIRNAASQVGQF